MDKQFRTDEYWKRYKVSDVNFNVVKERNLINTSDAAGAERGKYGQWKRCDED